MKKCALLNVKEYVIIRKYMEKYERKGNRGNFIDLYKICKILIECRMIRRNSDNRAYDYNREQL